MDDDVADATMVAFDPKNLASLPRDADGFIALDKIETTNDGWWNDDNVAATKKGEKRFDTLAHNGVMFPDEYEPHGIPILYEGKPFAMNAEEEELATHFASMRESEYYTQPHFRKNFFYEFQKVLAKRAEPHPVKELAMCSFDAIWDDFSAKREARRNMSKEDKKALKEKKEAIDNKFKFCLMDGRKERVANFRVEPPGLFRGRGEHPKRGLLKTRTYPEDITLNLSPGVKPPPLPPGKKWKEITFDNTKTWLAKWEDNVTGECKYVGLGASSTVKGLSDREKFDRARRLGEHIGEIRSWYTKQMNSDNRTEQQLGVATYFIDILALRVGNEKGDDEADTVGCLSLRIEHVKLNHETSEIHFNFLGKDSIRYDNVVKVEPLILRLVEKFCAHRENDTNQKIFNRIDPAELNDNFKQFMPDLSAKVFRTYNASKCLEQYFKANPLPKSAGVSEKLVYFNKANTEVAILCNHQKSVSRSHHQSMAKMAKQEEHFKMTIERLTAAADKLTQNKKADFKSVAEDFFILQDAEQREWLEHHGSDEEKKAFDEEIAARDLSNLIGKRPGDSIKENKAKKEGGSSKPKSAGKKKASSSSSKKTRTIDDLGDDEPLFGGRKAKKEEDSDDDDAPMAFALSPSGAKKTAGGAKKTPVKPEADSDEEDTKPKKKAAAAKKSPVKASSPAKKPTPKKPAAKAAAAKKAAPKKAAPKKAAPKKGGKKK